MVNHSDVHFYDTSSLLLADKEIFSSQEIFLISSITLKELEDIKNSSNKDETIKYKSRVLLRLLNEYPYCQVVVHKTIYELPIKDADLEKTNDTKILSDAIYANNILFTDRIIFITNDLSLKNMANLFFGDGQIQSIEEKIDTYEGYLEVAMDKETMAEFYQNTSINLFDLKVGEYLIIRDADHNYNIVDSRVWTGEDHRYLNVKPFKSKWFGQISPYNNDIYQKLAFDSLRNNQITMLKGPPGSGKTYIALGYLMTQLEKHEIDKIIIFCNPVAAIHSAKLGYTPGSLVEKILDTQIGNILLSKLGDRCAVEQLITEGKLLLLPFSNLRGFDTTGMRAGIYITEAQNLDINLMKLALQRIGEDCICIIDGDQKSQVDMIAYSGDQNGMQRASQIYRGHNIYGEVTLKNIFRSEIAKLAEEM